MSKSSLNTLSLSFLETQTVIDSLFDSLDVIHDMREKLIFSLSLTSEDELFKLDKRWDEIHYVLDMLLDYQKSLI